MNHFGELLTAMVTPFTVDNKVNLKKAKELARYLIENGSDGLVVLGTTGEVPVLTGAEKLNLLEAVLEEVGDEAVVIAGTGSYSTAASIELTEDAGALGVDGIMLVVPYYNKPPQSGLYEHFRQIAAVTDLPMLLYNVPSRTSRNLEVDTVVRLSEVENIIAIKEAAGDLGQAADLTRRLPDDFYVYSGDDNLTLPILSVGGQGVVSVASHLVGREIKEMITAFKAGDLQRAIELNKYLGPIFNGIFLNTNPIPVKTALNLTGHQVGGLRPPLTELTGEENEALKRILDNYKLLQSVF